MARIPFKIVIDTDGGGGGGSGDMLKSVYDASNITEQLAGLTAAQTLTNKTLTDPTLDVGLITSDNTNGTILVANGTKMLPVLMSGDATIASDGTVTVVGGGVSSVVEPNAKVNEVSGINKGQVVYLSGATGGSPQVSLASNNDFDKVGVIAMANETKTNNQTISVTILGLVENLDTSSFTEGDKLFLGVNGNVTNIHPASVIAATVVVGQAVKINASTGTIYFSIDNQTLVDTFDGTVRQMIVNQSNGTSAVASHTYVNDLNHRGSISLTSSTNTQGAENLSMFNEGYGNTNFLLDGNHPFVWFADVTDSHNGSFVPIMNLEPDGELIVDTVTSLVNIETRTNTTETIVASDSGKTLNLNNTGAITVTFQQDATLDLPIGTIVYFGQANSGAITFVGGGTATINSKDGNLTTNGAQTEVYVYKIGADLWRAVGDLV